MLHTVVISDIHLSEVEPGDGLWMRYRQRKFSPDVELGHMLASLRREVHRRGDDARLSLVLNGDVFDLDAPRVVGRESVFHDLPRNAEHAVPAVAAILEDNPMFVEGVGRILADGHSIVFVSGNHDVQLTLPEVRAFIRSRLVDAALACVTDAGPSESAALEARVLFRAWFHRTADGIVIEHGNQYDPYCSYRYPMAPFGRDRQEIQPTMGSLATRLLVSRMGYFNPHVDSSFMLSLPGYLWHWLRYYAFTRRSLAFAWAAGAVRTLIELVRRRDPANRRRRRGNIAACARETKAAVRAVARHARLFARPAEDRLDLVMRELWVDRGALLLTILLAVPWLVWAPRILMPLAALPLVMFLVYELMVPKVPLSENWRHLGRVARKVGKIHRAAAVVFGHTHHPEGAWENGVFFGNTGSWSAAYRDIECTKPLSPERPLVWLTNPGDGAALDGGLVVWTAGRFEPRVIRDTAGARPDARIPLGTPAAA